jgi:hypothetical protein
MSKKKMLLKREIELSEREEILLCRYFDEEAGWWARLSAKRLIARNVSAQDFYDSLTKIKGAVSANVTVTKDEPSDFWEKISTRLDAEERAAFYLGERRNNTLENRASSWYNFISSQALWGGLSGAATTALVLLFVAARPNTDTSLASVLGDTAQGNTAQGNTAQGNLGSPPQNGFRQVALNNPMSFIDSGGLQSNFINQARTMTLTDQATLRDQAALRDRSVRNARPVVFNDRSSSMEVDWMRSNGPLKLIQNPNEQSTIIWIKRRGGSVAQSAPTVNRQQVTPEVIFTSSPGSLNSPTQYLNPAPMK